MIEFKNKFILNSIQIKKLGPVQTQTHTLSGQDSLKREKESTVYIFGIISLILTREWIENHLYYSHKPCPRVYIQY